MLDKTKRYLRISGTRIGKIIGASKWGGPFEAYQEILDPDGRPKERSEDMKRGIHLEAGIVEWYKENFKPKEVIYDPKNYKPGTIFHPKIECFCASPDGIIVSATGERQILEIKAPRSGEDWGEEGTDEIPYYYKPQVNWEMLCAGIDVATVVSFHDGTLHVYRVAADKTFQQFLMDEGMKFWNNHIVPQIPPTDYKCPEYAKYLNKKYEKVEEVIAFNDVYIEEAAKEFLLAKDAFWESKEKFTETENQLKELMGSSKRASGTNYEVTWSSVQGRESVDWQSLAMHFCPDEELILQYTGRGDSYKRLQVRKK